MVAMVLRDYEPGAKFDWMPIFEGKQGIGKSSLGRLLVGDKYFVDWLPDLSDKDSALSLQGAWAVEFGELTNLRKQDVESAKAFISRTVDKVRPPYGRIQIESPRRCVFFGTTNSDTYLRDDSGNRRFKPVKVGQLDFDAIARDREQLFAEALFIYVNGFETEKTLDIEGKAKEYEAKIQAEKMLEDESTFMVEDFKKFMKNEAQKRDEIDTRFNFEKFKLTELFSDGWDGPFRGYKSDMRHLQFAAKALKQLGAEKFKSSGSVFWRFNQEKGIPTKTTPTLYRNGKSASNTMV
jgi:putative DNA primase/helicase